jgi:Cytotoxic translational repressor of toxin-antitoxin stability system
MASYKLLFKRSVAKDLRAFPRRDVARILQKVDALAVDPREKLSGRERYRVRQGVYRILYEIHDLELVVTVIKIGHRREVYRLP